MPENRKAPDQTALAQVARVNTTLVRVEQGATFADMVNGVAGAPRLMTNLDLNRTEDKLLMLNSAGTADYDVDRLEGEPILMSYWMVEVATVKSDETGELATVPRCTLFDANGKFIAFSAWSVARWLDKFRMAFGDGPYQPPIPVRFRRVSAGKGQQSYDVKVG